MAVIEFTDNEKEYLTLLFKIGNLIIEAEDGCFNPLSMNCIDRNEFFNLSDKLGIEY